LGVSLFFNGLKAGGCRGYALTWGTGRGSRVECKKVGVLDHRSDVRILYLIFEVHLLHKEHWQPLPPPFLS